MNQPTPPSPSGRAGRSLGAALLLLTAAVVTLGADLLVKHLSFEHVAGRPVRVERQAVLDAPSSVVPPHDPVVVVPGVLNLQLTLNTGAVFGAMPGRQTVLALVSLGAVLVIGVVFYRSGRRQWVLHLCLGLILAGALGNLYDRLRFAAVRDMLHLFPGVKLPWGLRWPARGGAGSDELYPFIFNVADVALVAAVVILITRSFFQPRPARAPRTDRG